MDATIWEPAPISVATARCSAAWPDAVAMAPAPFSRAATRSSNTATVGLLMREYTCPARSILNSDAACSLSRNTKEVVRWIGVARAPVAGSGAAPACRASVSNRVPDMVSSLVVAVVGGRLSPSGIVAPCAALAMGRILKTQ
ncbi:hypothetical protein D3C72_1786060 [compost metagenome]